MTNTKSSLSTFWVIIVILIGLVIGGIFMLSRQGAPNTDDPFAITSNDHIKGNKEAPITIIEYSDFQCPACKNYAPIVSKIVADYPEDVKVIYRHFPLSSIHPFAISSARASEAAGQQGKFWEMHDVLFNNQFDWSNAQKPEELYVSYAQALDLDVKQFESDMKSNVVKRKVNGDRAQALRLRLTGTPTLFIEGERAPSFSSYDDFSSYIEERITQKTGKTFTNEVVENTNEESISEDAQENNNNEETQTNDDSETSKTEKSTE